MALYNALVRDEHKRILAKTCVTSESISEIPWTWQITYNEKDVVTVGRNILCSPSKPLSIIIKPSSAGSHAMNSMNYIIQVICFGYSGVRRAQVNESTSPADLYKMTGRLFNSDPNDFRLICNEVHVPNTDGVKLIEAFPNVTLEKIEMRPILRGGAPPGFVMADIEGEKETGKGVRLKRRRKVWRAFTKGLNVIGRCARISCPSNQDKHIREDVYFQLGFEKFLLTLTNFVRFECPACRKFNFFKANNFLVAGARATFRFRKIGEEEVRIVTLEAIGPFPEYATFNENGGVAEYEFMEITIVKKTQSTQFCVSCDERIESLQDETRKRCDHIFHKKCAQVATHCPVCMAPDIKTEEVDQVVPLCHGF